jgi:ketosteroid isomerase-like protein
MSEENLEILRRTYGVINSVGRSGPEFVDPEELAPDVWALLAEDLELHERPDLPDAKVYRGREQSKEFWRKTQEIFSRIEWEPKEFIDLDHAVVVMTTVRATGRGSEVETELEEADVFWFRDGTIVRLQAFPSRKEALEAAAGG